MDNETFLAGCLALIVASFATVFLVSVDVKPTTPAKPGTVIEKTVKPVESESSNSVERRLSEVESLAQKNSSKIGEIEIRLDTDDFDRKRTMLDNADPEHCTVAGEVITCSVE